MSQGLTLARSALGRSRWAPEGVVELGQAPLPHPHPPGAQGPCSQPSCPVGPQTCPLMLQLLLC